MKWLLVKGGFRHEGVKWWQWTWDGIFRKLW